jgi:predicted DNA-binding protein
MKNKTPPAITFFLSEELLKRFNDYCKENSLNKSALIRQLIEKELDNKANWMTIKPDVENFSNKKDDSLPVLFKSHHSPRLKQPKGTK